MAGNRRTYDAAMKRAGGLAWDKKWSRAIEEYEKALIEFPEDVGALTGVGLGYVETKQLEKALDVYKKAANLNPENPEVIQRVGYIYERLAQLPAAARAYVLAGEAAVRLQDMSQAIELWRKACVLAPTNLEAHRNLVRAYQDQTEDARAAWHYLIMARILARSAKFDDATECAHQAFNLDPRNVEADEMLEALQRGLPLPDGPTARLQPDKEGKRSLDSFVVFEEIEVGDGGLFDQETHVSPADMVLRRSLARMADALFSDDIAPNMMQTSMLLGQAADFQTRGLEEQALDAYTKAIRGGADSAAVRFNMGLLYQARQDFARAVDSLSRALKDPDLMLGAQYAIGECYVQWGKEVEALPYLLESLRLLDTQTVPPAQVADLNHIYERLTRSYAGANGSGATLNFVKSIIDFFGARGWNERILRSRKQMDTLSKEGVMALGELLIDPYAPIAMEAMANIQKYVGAKLIFTAIEECLWAIRQAPFYLPLHQTLAELLVTEDRPQEAAQKYAIVAQTYQVRGELDHAIDALRRSLDIAPMDVDLRENLIDMLIDARQYDQAIEHRILMADTYYQLAQIEKSIDQYNEALRYAPQGDPNRHWDANILHRIGDIYVQRVDWRQAVKIYQRVKRIEPGDERARVLLIDLCFKTGQRAQAIKEVDDLVTHFKSARQPDKLVSTMRTIVDARTDELALHMRLAKVFLDMRRTQDAIAELDAVGEIQMNQGKNQDAIRTIQAIIRLGPDQVDGYRQLLTQLKQG